MAAPLRTVPGSGGDPLAEAIELTRRLELPDIRRSLTDIIPTAKGQRWDPAEVVRVLLAGKPPDVAGPISTLAASGPASPPARPSATGTSPSRPYPGPLKMP